MYICEGEVVGMNSYVKEGVKKYYVQVIYNSKINGYTGKRVCSCPAANEYKVGAKVKIVDDFKWPQILEN